MDPTYELGKVRSSKEKFIFDSDIKYFSLPLKTKFTLTKKFEDDKEMKNSVNIEKSLTNKDYFKNLTKCNFSTHDSLRIANVDVLAGITKYSGGYLAQTANFTDKEGYGTPFYFATFGNSGSFSEYFNWRRLDSYGLIFYPSKPPDFYKLIDYERVQYKTNFENALDYGNQLFKSFPLDIVICDTIKDILSIETKYTKNDLKNLLESLIYSTEFLKEKDGIHVTFLKESESKLSKEYIFLHSLMFEKISLVKLFASHPDDKSCVLICKNLIRKFPDIKNQYNLFSSSIDKDLDEYIEKFNKQIKFEKYEFNYPRIISAWGLTSDSKK